MGDDWDEPPKSDYELLRERNIAIFKELFKQKFGEDAFDKPLDPLPEPRPTKAARKKRTIKKLSFGPTRRSKRISKRKSFESDDTDYSESDCDDYKSDDGDYENDGFKGFPKVFRGFKPDKKKKDNNNSDSEYSLPSSCCEGSGDEDYNYKETKRRTYTPRINLRLDRDIPKPEDITDADIGNIWYASHGKTYDINGTTCHQCRQKTRDMKSICRGNECSGVRGQFCGFCLKRRYGEDVAEVLRDPDWICPPCRNICNCSICRRRKGKLPTGILVPYALDNGYDSVKEFLEKVDVDKVCKSKKKELPL